MSTPQIKIIDLESGEEIIRDANEQELAQIEKDALESVRLKAEAEAKAAQKAALLERLGISEDEARLLLS